MACAPSGAEGLDFEQIEGEGRLRPRQANRGHLGGELKWPEVALTNEVIDCNALLEHQRTPEQLSVTGVKNTDLSDEA